MLTKVLRASRKLRIKVASLIAVSKAARRVSVVIKGILVAVQRVDVRVRRAVGVAVTVAVVVVVDVDVLRREDNTRKSD
jgi:hypothetical protein